MGMPNGVHHLAICTKDIKQQIAFCSEVLGAELVALFWMHGVPGGWHCFLRLSDESFLSFVQTPEMAEIEIQLGVTHAGNGANASAPGTLQHAALHVASAEELLAMRDRIRSHGVHVFGPIDHGFCQSIYFAGPEDLSLEITTAQGVIDPRAWIDPEVAELAGISDEELERFVRPEPPPPGPALGQVPQPDFDREKPFMRGYAESDYRRMLEIPDEVLTERASIREPPVRVAGD